MRNAHVCIFFYPEKLEIATATAIKYKAKNINRSGTLIESRKQQFRPNKLGWAKLQMFYLNLDPTPPIMKHGHVM